MAGGPHVLSKEDGFPFRAGALNDGLSRLFCEEITFS
jgi:hypothetical protein